MNKSKYELMKALVDNNYITGKKCNDKFHVYTFNPSASILIKTIADKVDREVKECYVLKLDYKYKTTISAKELIKFSKKAKQNIVIKNNKNIMTFESSNAKIEINTEYADEFSTILHLKLFKRAIKYVQQTINTDTVQLEFFKNYGPMKITYTDIFNELTEIHIAPIQQ